MLREITQDNAAQLAILMELAIGIRSPQSSGANTVSAATHCCEVCTSMEGCSHWRAVSSERSADKSTLGRCILYAN